MPSRAKAPAAPLPAFRAAAPPHLFVGTSGWAYPSWKPGFYPPGVPARRFLAEYSTRLTSVEVNYTFRTLPTAAQLTDWIAATPAGFLFSFKAPQSITHFRRLRDCGELVAEFVAALAPVRSARKLGVLLFQLPPNFQADPDRLAALLDAPALRGRNAPRIALEFRHPSWFVPPVYALLRRRRAALCIAETEDFQTPEVHTASFRCFRLRRSGGYTGAELDTLAGRLTAAAVPTFAYFKHEEEPTGALGAEALLQRVRERAGGVAA